MTRLPSISIPGNAFHQEPDLAYNKPNQLPTPHPPEKPFTLGDFLSLTRSMDQERATEREQSEQKRRLEQEGDIKNFRALLGISP